MFKIVAILAVCFAVTNASINKAEILKFYAEKYLDKDFTEAVYFEIFERLINE